MNESMNLLYLFPLNSQLSLFLDPSSMSSLAFFARRLTSGGIRSVRKISDGYRSLSCNRSTSPRTSAYEVSNSFLLSVLVRSVPSVCYSRFWSLACRVKRMDAVLLLLTLSASVTSPQQAFRHLQLFRQTIRQSLPIGYMIILRIIILRFVAQSLRGSGSEL